MFLSSSETQFLIRRFTQAKQQITSQKVQDLSRAFITHIYKLEETLSFLRK
jgi:hypothetical protein